VISLINLQYFGRNFETRNARKSIKPFKGSYHSLFSNKSSSQKMALGIGVQDPMMSSYSKQNMHKYTPII